MYQILVVEDSKDIQDLVLYALQPIAFCLVAPSLEMAQKLFLEKEFDLILLDIQLEDGDGFTLAQIFRNNPKGKDIPIIFYSSKSDFADKEMGFKLGAEDYIVKPCDVREIRLRVEHRLEKIRSRTLNDKIHKGDLLLDISKQKAYFVKSEEEIILTPLQFKILQYLIMHDDRTVSREELVSEIWGKNVNMGRSVDTHINSLRRKLKHYQDAIQSIYGSGYIFKIIK